MLAAAVTAWSRNLSSVVSIRASRCCLGPGTARNALAGAPRSVTHFAPAGLGAAAAAARTRAGEAPLLWRLQRRQASPTTATCFSTQAMASQDQQRERQQPPPPPPTKVAVGQMTATGDHDANLATCSRLAKDAEAQGCSMLFLPECFAFIGSSQQQSVQAAQPLDGPLMGRYRSLAQDTGLWLSLGGFQEAMGPESDGSKIFNTHVVLDPQGALVAAYRKVHLFNVDVPNGPVLLESRTTAPGSELVACDSPAGRVGLSVCYDVRFPEVYEALTWRMGAQVLTVPSAFTKVTGEAHWEVLLRARAIECQAYVIAAAQAGKHNEKRESYGHSLIIDPWGRVVARLNDPLATGIAVCEIDHQVTREVRDRMPIEEHRRQGRLCLGWGDDVPRR